MEDYEDPKHDKPHVSFSTDGRGKWWKTTYPRQCPEDVFTAGRCQGVEGHKGCHWRYGPSGELHYDDNDLDPSCGGSSGWIPPGHKEYKHPEEMQKLRYSEFRTTEEVTDPEELARLEQGNLRVGESSQGPFRLEDEEDPEKREKIRKALEESKKRPHTPPRFGEE